MYDNLFDQRSKHTRTYSVIPFTVLYWTGYYYFFLVELYKSNAELFINLPTILQILCFLAFSRFKGKILIFIIYLQISLYTCKSMYTIVMLIVTGSFTSFVTVEVCNIPYMEFRN